MLTAPWSRTTDGERRGREFSPVDSTYDEQHHYNNDTLAILFRAINGTLHAAVCLLLMSIMVDFIVSLKGQFPLDIVPQAVILTIFLGLDSILDGVSLLLIRTPWKAWALMLRLAFAMGYLAIFMSYIATRRVFTRAYTYWELDEGYATPVVYLLLWIIGMWDLVHIALHRHRIGYDFRDYLGPARRGHVREGRRDSYTTFSWILRHLWRRSSGVGQGTIAGQSEQNRPDDVETRVETRAPPAPTPPELELAERRDTGKTVESASSSSTDSEGQRPSPVEIRE